MFLRVFVCVVCVVCDCMCVGVCLCAPVCVALLRVFVDACVLLCVNLLVC